MKPRWFIEHRGGRKEQEELQKLVYTLEMTEHEVKVDRYKPFGAMEFDDKFFNKEVPVVCYGSINLGSAIGYNKPAFIPGFWMDLFALRCQYYYAKLGKYIMAPYYGFYPLSEVLRMKEQLFAMYSEPGDTPAQGRLLFVRPDANDKCFTGEVLGERYFDSWHKSIAEECAAHTMCVVAPFMPIEEEWRLVIADGKPVTGSKYKENDYVVYEEGFPDDVGQLATEIAKTWSPHPVWVLDIARSRGVPKLLELGSVNCAGWYKCDVKKIIEAVDTAATRDWEKYNKPKELRNELADLSDSAEPACATVPD